MNTRAHFSSSSSSSSSHTAPRDGNRFRSLSLDDLDDQAVSSSPVPPRRDDAVNDTGMEEDSNGRDTLGELGSPAIESLQDRLLVTPIRWQARSTASPMGSEPGALPSQSSGSSSSSLYRRDSAPAAGAAALLLRNEEAATRRLSNPALLETIEEGRVSCRRKSMPAVMVHGQIYRQRTGGGVSGGGGGGGSGALHLSPRRTLLMNAATGTSPAAGAGAAPARRRSSMPEISSSSSPQRGTVTLETFYPPPRRNSLMSCSLSEVAARFELLNTNSSVPEESELLERSRAGYERNNGTGVGSAARNLSPITL